MNLDRFQKGMDALINAVAWVEKVIGTIAMAFIILINIYGITSRYLFDRPVLYVHELTILGAVWLFFIGMGLVFKVHSDITVEFLVRLFPHRLKLVNALIVEALAIFFTIVLAWQTVLLIPYTRGASHILSFALGLPDEIYFYPIGVGAISILLAVSHSFIRHLASFRSDWYSDPDKEPG
jgi:TRAP-type C4-dicarboxylate transport system permease small subunit